MIYSCGGEDLLVGVLIEYCVVCIKAARVRGDQHVRHHHQTASAAARQHEDEAHHHFAAPHRPGYQHAGVYL